MAGFLIAAIDSIFMFSGTWPRFVIVFLISSVVAAGFFYLWMLQLRDLRKRRNEVRLHLESLSQRQVTMLAIGLLILVVIWLIQKLSWLNL